MSKNFLLVDDDIDDLELLREGLSSADKTIICHEASNGCEALDLLKANILPDLIFLDINMPKMGGWECLQILKSDAAYKNIAVLIYSTSSFQKDIDYAADLGAWGFYTKPVNFMTLKQKLLCIIDAFEKEKTSDAKFLNFNKVAF